MIRLTVVMLAVAAVFVPAAAPLDTASYSGTIRFRGAETSTVAVKLGRGTVTVSLGPGHVAHADVPLKRKGKTLRFAAPGLPKPIVFQLTSKGKKLSGTATQGAAHATVTLTRGRTSADTKLGYFSSPNAEVARFTTHGFSTQPFAIDLATGAFGAAPAQAGKRLDIRQYDVRFPNGKTTLAGTLTVPPGAGPHPAVVYVSGSGDTLREESHWLDGLFVAHGIAVLAYDKRGVGQSGGVYPGDLASEETINTLAGDAAAAARFVAAQAGNARYRRRRASAPRGTRLQLRLRGRLRAASRQGARARAHCQARAQEPRAALPASPRPQGRIFPRQGSRLNAAANFLTER